MKTERWPDFIVIGAGKSGTTALNEYLDQHPNIFMSLKKEPNFFALETVDINSYEFEESRQYHLQSVYKKEDYLQLFEHARPDQLLGEISNMYMYSDEAYKNIKKYAPGAKLIAILRQPAERLHSRYMHLVREDEVPDEGWQQLFDENSIWWRRPDLIPEGFYFKHLQKFFEIFPADRLKIFLYEDFRRDAESVMSEILNFIGAESEIAFDFDISVNKSGRKKKNLFNRMFGQNGIVINLAKKALPEVHSRLKRNKTVIKYLNKARNKHIVSEKLDEETKARITNEIYREDILELQKLLNRDLSHWL